MNSHREITEFVTNLIGEDKTKLQIVQIVMDRFGQYFPSYSFTKWCTLINDIIDSLENSTQHQSSISEIKNSSSDHNINAESKHRNTTFSTNCNNETWCTDVAGAFCFSFKDGYCITKPNLKDLFKLFINYIGPYTIKGLNIRVNNRPLISHTRSNNNKDIEYPILSSCYLYILCTEHQILDIIANICSSLLLSLTLKKGESTIFTSENGKITKNVIHPKNLILNRFTVNNHTSSTELIKPIDNKQQILSKYISSFSSLRTASRNKEKAPHKPILLLAVIELISKGNIIDNRIFFNSSLIEQFNKIWSILVDKNSRYSPTIINPFIALDSDGFWKLKTIPGAVFPSSPTIKWIKDAVLYAYLKDDLFNLLLSDEDARKKLKQTLINSYFSQINKAQPQVEKKSLSFDDYLKVVGSMSLSSISNQTAPHKPILLLTLIDLISMGTVIDNKFPFNDDLNTCFNRNWIIYNNRRSFHLNIGSPFTSLVLENFWHLEVKHSSSKISNSPSWIKKNVMYGYLDSALFSYLLEPKNRTIMRKLIIDTYDLKHL